MLRLSANLGFLWPDRPLLDRIAAAAAAGFRAVELHWPYDVPPASVRAACADHGVALLALNTPLGERPGDFGLGALPGREAEFASGFAQALDYALAAGAGAIHVMAGTVPPERRREGQAALVANLKRVAEAAERHGLTLLLEAINRRDRPDYFYDGVEDAAAVIAEAGSPAVRLMFDCYHAQVSQGDVTRRLEALLPVIGHVQIAAAPSRAEPDEGELDYRCVFAALERIGYAGWIGCEYLPRGDTDAGLGWRRTLGV